jgi:periplasmic copper chaperone A
VFTARPGNGIAPGEFRDFGLSLGMPERPSARLTFKALQTYSSGEVVRWIGPPDADEPAPQVELTAAASSAAGPAAAAAARGARSEEDEQGTDALAIVAVIAGGLGLLVGIAALLAARRLRAT